MRVLIISAGTGAFHCGLSLRDEALAAGMRAAGHAVDLVPVYLPLQAEDPATHRLPVFMGGINVWLQQHCRLFHLTPRWLDALLDRPAFLRWAAGWTDMTRARGMGRMTLSMLQGLAGKQANELHRLLDALAHREPYDLIVLCSILLSGFASALRARLRAPVLCQAGGEEGFLDSLESEWCQCSWDAVRTNLRSVDRCLAMSTFAREALAPRLGLPADRWQVVAPGLDLAGYGPATPPEPPVLGFLGHLAPVKGLHVVVDAFLRLCQEDVVPGLKLHVAGSHCFADRHYLRRQRRRLAAAGLADRCRFLINPDRAAKQVFLRGLSVLAVCPIYPEAFGLALIEAAATGVPVVAPDRGALSAVLAALDGGVTYAVDDVTGPDPQEGAKLACALGTALQDRSLAAIGSDRVDGRTRQHYGHEAYAARVLTAASAARTIFERERSMSDVLIRLEAVTKTFGGDGAPTQTVLDAVDLEIVAGSSLGIVGPSGAGKSTMLNLLGALDVPTSGRVFFAGEDIAGFNEVRQAELRNRRIGFIFQDHHLLPQLTVRENVLLPALARQQHTTAEERQRADDLLTRVGLADRGDDWPRHLSGGERQRVAVIRALINRPDLVLADEPTGALDHRSSATLAELLLELQRDLGTALVVVTHQLSLARRLDRALELRDGHLGDLPAGD